MPYSHEEERALVALAREKIASESSWWPGSLAADAHGTRVDYDDPSACRWSIDGALTLICGGPDEAEQVLRSLDMVAEHMFGCPICEINDEGHREVLEVLDEYLGMDGVTWMALRVPAGRA